jgi:predicted TPR repeat methyltransferase
MSNEASTDLDKLLAEAIAHHRQGELTKAEWAYEGVLEIDPKQPDALHLLGVIAHQMGDTTLAIERVNASLAANPDQPTALNNLGNMLADAGRLDEAIESYQRAIGLNPDYAQAHHNLGNVLADRDRAVESIDSYRRSIELCPDDVQSRLSLGTMLEKFGEFDEAIAEYRKAITIDSDSIAGRSRLGAVLRKTNRLTEARAVYGQLLELVPDDPLARHFHASCEADNPPERASADYVKSTFDSFADEFDSRLAELKYQVPELFNALLEKHFGQSTRGQWNVADLGCGTGICASYLRGYASRLVGVDLSAGMLAKSQERDLYDELLEAELTEFLQGRFAEYDLLVAADTLIYIGDLRSTFAAASDALNTGGHLLFSIEKLADGVSSTGYRLEPSGRYSHDAEFVRRWLEDAGFDLKELADAEVREEGDEATVGCLVMACKR